MAKTFLAMDTGHPRNSSVSEVRAAQGGGLVGEAKTFVDNSGIRSNFIGNENAQIRHFVASFIAASYPLGRWDMLGRDLANTPEARADRAVTNLAARLFDRNAGHIGVIREYLANDIRREFAKCIDEEGISSIVGPWVANCGAGGRSGLPTSGH